MIDLLAVGTPSNKYPPKESQTFLTMGEYLTEARRLVMGLASKAIDHTPILNNEDSISYIAHAMMLGDWRWNPNYRSKSGKVRTRTSYRNQCAIWAINQVVGRSVKDATKLKQISFNRPDNLSISIPHSNNDGAEQQVEELLEHAIKRNVIKLHTKKFIKLYYLQNYTFREIANRYSKSHEWIRQVVTQGITNLQKMVKNGE
jgi:hypothetical protein